MPPSVLDYDDQIRLRDAVLNVNSILEPSHRRMYVDAVRSLIDAPLPVVGGDDARHDIWEIVAACASYRGGLHCLTFVLRDFLGDSDAVVYLMELVGTVESRWLLESRDRARLRRLLEHRSRQDFLLGLAASGMPFPVDDLDLPRQAEVVIDRLEESAPPREDHPLLRFVDGVAHRLPNSSPAVDLHQWINALGKRLRFSEIGLRELCEQSELVRDQYLIDAGPSPRTGRQSRNPRQPHPANSPLLVRAASGVEVITTTDQNPRPSEHVDADAAGVGEVRAIWGGVPGRNPHFVGRKALLNQLRTTLVETSKASVLPQTLQGLGGVGKTMVAVEYVYRYKDEYDWIWWISAEEPAEIRASLAELGRQLNLPPSVDLSQTVSAVLSKLGSATQRWLLVYDNADLPSDLTDLTPTARGHVLITSRNQAWSVEGNAIEVDLFDRPESIQLLQVRTPMISEGDANLLANKLGDLPLALEQAANWRASTGMPVAEYLELFDEHASELMSEGLPPNYPFPAAVTFGMAFDRLKQESVAAAQLLELFTYLGSEPVSLSLLRSGRGSSGISPVLRSALDGSIELARAIRSLRRYGLAKVDANDRQIWVHRLVQAILREKLEPDELAEAQANVHEILAQAAKLSEPDDHSTWARHMEIRPHVIPADLIRSDNPDAPQVVLDQIRFLYASGDYEGSRSLGERALVAWSGFPDDHEHTLLATRHLANTLRALGEYERAYELDQRVLNRLTAAPAYGERHEHTLRTKNSFGADLRIRGAFLEALANDKENLELHRSVFTYEDDPNVLRTKGNLAVDYRLTGDFRTAQELDRQIVISRQLAGEKTPLLASSISNLARDYYDLGDYQQALDLQLQNQALQREQLGPFHLDVLLAARTVAMARRKLGQYAEALTLARDLDRDYRARLGHDHEHTLLATMTYVNSLRVVGELAEARRIGEETIAHYRTSFGEEHPFTLAALTNLAIVYRTSAEVEPKDTREESQKLARELDEFALASLSRVLGADHPYALCAASNLAIDLWLDGEEDASRKLSERIYLMSVEKRGELAPYTLACALNYALALREVEAPEAEPLLAATLANLAQVRGAKHPATLDAGRGKRAECDIEPPPT